VTGGGSALRVSVTAIIGIVGSGSLTGTGCAGGGVVGLSLSLLT
jgi:hypothetical protein